MNAENAPTVVSNDAEELPSLLLPITEGNLLIPTTNVAEIVPYVAPVADLNAPNWNLGIFHWRERQVPVLAYEELNDKHFAGPQLRSRIAVLNNTDIDGENLPFIAIVTQGVPRLIRLNEQEVDEVEGGDTGPADLMAITVSGEKAHIPNVRVLEEAYLNDKK